MVSAVTGVKIRGKNTSSAEFVKPFPDGVEMTESWQVRTEVVVEKTGTVKVVTAHEKTKCCAPMVGVLKEEKMKLRMGKSFLR